MIFDAIVAGIWVVVVLAILFAGLVASGTKRK